MVVDECLVQLTGSWKLFAALLSIATSFSGSPIPFYLLSFRAPDDFAVATAGPNFSSWMWALCEAELDRVGHCSGLPCLSIPASLPSQKPLQCCSWLRSSLEKEKKKRKEEQAATAARHQLAQRSRSRVRMAMCLASTFLPSCYAVQTARSVLH